MHQGLHKIALFILASSCLGAHNSKTPLWLLGTQKITTQTLDLSSVQFSHSVVSYPLWPHELQHSRPPCLSPAPRVHSNSCPSSLLCHPAIPSSVVPFFSCPQSLPASEAFPMSQLIAQGGQSIGVSALASVLPKNTQTDLLQNGLVGSPCSPRDSPTPQFRSINSSVFSLLYGPVLTSKHDYWKNHSLD